MGRRIGESYFESPHAVTYVLILTNSAIFGLTLIGNSLLRIDPVTLFHYGAIYKTALERHEYWRLIAYAFLHGNALHLALNMLCIAAWSGLLEKRLGATYFTLVYLASVIAGGVASIYGHPGAFLTVGASGGISGIVGGLLCLMILGKLPLSPQFFVITIGANAMLAARMPNADWMAHLGGFTAGFAACAILEGVAAFARFWLRCKFPEFVKFGIAVAAFCALALLNLDMPYASGSHDWLTFAAWAAALVIAIKLTDLALARTKGLAVLTFAMALVYGSLPLAAGTTITATLPAYCERARAFALASPPLSAAHPYIGSACQHAEIWPMLLAMAIFLAVLFVLRLELRRGLSDVGFVANTFRAERKRRQGL